MQVRPMPVRSWRAGALRTVAGLLVLGMALRALLLGVAVYGTPSHTCGCSAQVCCCFAAADLPRLESCRSGGSPEAGFAFLLHWVEPAGWTGVPQTPAVLSSPVGNAGSLFAVPPERPEPPPRDLPV